MNKDDISQCNQEAWEEVSVIHKKYRFERLLNGFKTPGFSCITGIKQEAVLKHGLKNKAVVHPCCNNGRDLLSLKNMGADRCFGFDLSHEFIKQGQELAQTGNIDCELIQADVYKLGSNYEGQFDISYITAGTLTCLPDLDSFFSVISKLLKPGAWLFMQEIHPIMDMFTMEPSERIRWLRLKYPYFMKTPYLAKKGLDYYRSSVYKAKPFYRFHHKFSDIIQALLDNDLEIETIEERDNDTSGGRFKRIKRKKNIPPLSYTLTANRK